METNGTMSPADISALMGNREGYGDNCSWWIIILFLFCFMGGGNFFGGRAGELGQYATAASQQEILFGQQFQNLDNKMDRLGNGIADATFALNNTINGVQTVLGGQVTTEGRNLQAQLSQCCCENRLATANLEAKLEQQTGTLMQAVHAEGEQTRALIQANELQTLRDKVASLEMDNRMASVVRYPTSYSYSAGQSPFCGCNGCC